MTPSRSRPLIGSAALRAHSLRSSASASRPARAIDDLDADRRHHDRMPFALDQMRAERGFKFLDACGQRRLGDETGLGSLGEVEPFRYCDQVAQLAQRRQGRHADGPLLEKLRVTGMNQHRTNRSTT
jgi:hypothetical protein